ncbi:MAG: ribosome maturation factor RimM [Lachnospiraceae bacterium]
MEKEFQIGVITQPHGLKGEVKVFPTTDDNRRFEELKQIMLKPAVTDKGDKMPPAVPSLRRNMPSILEIEHVKYFKKYVILKFKGYDRIEDVESFRSMGLWIDREHALPLQSNEYYIADLIGMSVSLEDGTPFGTIEDVMQTGANDVYVVRTLQDQEVLLPAIKECIKKVDVENADMQIKLLDGLV